MMFASTVSRRSSRCAQVYATDFGWVIAFPMVSRSEAHETLLLLFARDMVQSKFYQNLKGAACHLKHLEPYTSWLNAAEREIKKLKKEASCKLLRCTAPKHLWDYCFELEAYIMSNSAHNIYKLQGEVPTAVMSGEASDISRFCKLEWFEWVVF